MASEDNKNWSDACGNRASFFGNESGAMFSIGVNDPVKKKVPDRLLKYMNKKEPLTAEKIAQRQQEAADRKKCHDDNRVTQARLIREEVMKFDKSMQDQLQKIQVASNQGSSETSQKGQWYKNAMTMKKS